MQLAAARASIATGVAVLGASVLVVSPVAPPVPDLPDLRVPAVHSVATELTALVNPIEVLTPIFQQAFQNAGALGQQLLHAPAEVAQQIITQQLGTVAELLRIASVFGEQFVAAVGDAPAKLQQAIGQISAGQITAGLNTLVEIVLTPVTGPVLEAIFTGSGPLVDLVDVLQDTFKFVPGVSNVVGLLADPDFLLTVGLGPLQSAYALTGAIGGTAETLIAAARAGDPAAFVNGVTNGVADVVSAVLDRLLNPGTPPYGYDRGLIAAVLEAGKMIIKAAFGLPAAPTSVAAVNSTSTSTGATTVTLSTDPVDTDAKPAAETASGAAESTRAAQEGGEPKEAPSTSTAKEEVAQEKSSTTSLVRNGLVAVPGEVTVGVSEKPASESAAQENSSSTENQSKPASDSAISGGKADPQTSGGASDGASASDAADSE